jgi:hypothetical protein
MNIDVYKKAGSRDESQNRIDDILAYIKNAKLKLTEFNCILGLELANQKLMYFKDKCDKCSRYKESGDEYVIFECSSCKCKPGNNCDEFVKRYIDKLRCKKDWINFLIKLARLYMRYPKIKYSTMPLDDVKRYMKDLWSFTSPDSRND